MRLNDFINLSFKTLRMHWQPGYRVPISVYIVLTNRCNNRCVYCRVHSLPQKDIWTTSSLKSALEQMKACGAFRVQFTGGEPMMRDDLGELVRFAKKLGLFVGISTNGHQIAERIEELMGVDVVFLSYEGPAQVHSRLRGAKSVEAVDSALAALKSAGIRVWTTTVLTRLNIGYIPEIVRFAEEKGILANFNRLEFCLGEAGYLHPLIEEIRDLVPTREELKNAIKEIIILKKKGAPIGSSLEYLNSLFEWPHDERITDAAVSERYACWAGSAYCHLESDGMLYPCGWAVSKGHKGESVLLNGFSASWENTKALAGCNSCSHACGVENNLLFSLNGKAVLNALSGLLKSSK